MPGTAQSGGRSVGKPRAQHEREGTFRKDRHAELKSPEPTPGRPDPPAELDNLGQQTWGRLMWAFEDMGMLHKVDAEAVFAYCQLWSDTQRVSEQQREAQAGLKILEENLGDIQAEDKVQLFSQIVALHKTVSKCTDQQRAGWMAIRQYLVEFGLTPASRGRIRLPSKREQVDEFSAYQRAKAG